MKVTLADSDVKHRQQLAEWVESAGYEVAELVSAEELLKVCKSKFPDLLIVSDSLPGAGIHDLILSLRGLGGHAVWNPIIVVGEKEIPENILKCKDAGADDFLLKPLDEIKFGFKLSQAKRIVDMKDDVFSVANDLVMANMAMEVAFTQDSLTGVMDITSFNQTLQKEWDAAQRNNKEICLAMINIDNFQQFNDVYGAPKGDETIKLVASALKQSLPKKYDFAARTIGDTFAILLPDTNINDAISVANKVHESINALKVEHSQSTTGNFLTVSVGVASSNEADIKSSHDLMEGADFALYQAKHKGRNRVFAQEPVKA